MFNFQTFPLLFLFAVGQLMRLFTAAARFLPSENVKLMANSFLHVFASQKESLRSGCDYKTSTEFIMQIVQVQFYAVVSSHFAFRPLARDLYNEKRSEIKILTSAV